MNYLLFTMAGYLSGSVLYACLLPKYFKNIDICAVSDDSNPGTVNAFRHAGFGIGMAVILCELLKAFLPVYIAAQTLDTLKIPFAFVITAPVAGHAFPFLKQQKKGGKAIAAAFGAVMALFPDFYPFAALAIFYILFSAVIIIMPHLFRSIITFILFMAAVVLFDPNPAVQLGCMMISGICIYKHLLSYHGQALSVRLILKKKKPTP